MSEYRLERDGTRLSYRDFGGSGPPVLLLHGLAGYAGEWHTSARLLVEAYRVFALDQRGHGHSERRPEDVSRSAYVEDCAATIRHIGLGPITLIGQSMGANTAMLTAAGYPDLVHGLVMIEGSPDGPDPPIATSEIAEQFTNALSAWPIPFPDEDAAHRFFTSRGFDPLAWTAGLERKRDGLWPRWEIPTLAETMAELGSRSYWPEWRDIECPTLVILGEHGIYPAGHDSELLARLPQASVITIPGAGHDVHLDAPQLWVEALRHSPVG